MELTTVPNDTGVDAAVAAARRIINALLHTGDTSAAPMDEIAEQLHRIADDLDSAAPHVHERMTHMWGGTGEPRHDPVTGPENALAPPLRLAAQDDGSISGVLTLGMPYQGPPGHVHGGITALLLDHALGMANHVAGQSGMTAELTLRYHRPTPLFEPLTVTARHGTVDGGRIRSRGTISAGGQVCVAAEGLFIAKHVPRPH